MPYSVDRSTYADSTSAVRFHSPNLLWSSNVHPTLFFFEKNSRIRDCCHNVWRLICDSVRQCRTGCINGWADSRGSWPSRPATASIHTLLVICTKQERHTVFFFLNQNSREEKNGYLAENFNARSCHHESLYECNYRRSAIWLG